MKLTPKILKKIRNKVMYGDLIYKYDGPFNVMKLVGNVAYMLKLSDKLKVH